MGLRESRDTQGCGQKCFGRFVTEVTGLDDSGAPFESLMQFRDADGRRNAKVEDVVPFVRDERFSFFDAQSGGNPFVSQRPQQAP